MKIELILSFLSRINASRSQKTRKRRAQILIVCACVKLTVLANNVAQHV